MSSSPDALRIAAIEYIRDAGLTGEGCGEPADSHPSRFFLHLPGRIVQVLKRQPVREVQSPEAKARFVQLLDAVERGETIVITRHGRF
jgi:hypothetical protein